MDIGRRRRGRAGAGRIPGVLLCSLALLGHGCLRIHSLAPEEIRKLDGFTEEDRVTLRDTVGSPVVFSRTASMWFVTAQQRLGPWNFAEVKIEGDRVSARLQGGAEVQIPLASLQILQVSEEDARNTASATFTDISTTGALVLFALLALGLAVFVIAVFGA